jgi:hypothetical protein
MAAAHKRIANLIGIDALHYPPNPQTMIAVSDGNF